MLLTRTLCLIRSYSGFVSLRRRTDSRYQAPTLVLDIPNIKLWYKPDAVFGKPKINVMAQFSTRSAYLTPRSAVRPRSWFDDCN